LASDDGLTGAPRPTGLDLRNRVQRKAQYGQEALVTELSSYIFSPLRDGGFTLYRGSGDGLTPILLVAAEDPSLGCLKQLEHEYSLKAELDTAWAARPVGLSRQNGRMTLVLEDPGGEPLDRLVGRPLAIMEFLRIAIPLATAIGRMHERGLIHKDIKPANVMVDRASGGAWLTGFGIASRLLRERHAPETPDVIAGTLAYMAPEQTGRMNRSIDSRSDLYALGVTFYELLTGALPFTASDPMEWIHCHIARQPAPPSECVTGMPAQLSAIVMRLLAKTAEERYQTAAGVVADLRRCLAAWESFGQIDPFPLGTQDASDRLIIPERLYGRQRETDALLGAFDRVVAHGAAELVLVSGYSGVGKSSVVNELHKALVPLRGLFACGKFDQHKRDAPYAALAQAFQTLVCQILVKSEVEVDQWRRALADTVGANGQLIVSLIPEVEFIIGKQPPVPELPPRDAQNRFQTVFRRFLGVFARTEHPLALFLDDLQWLDAATLNLIEHLVTHSEVRHLLLVGAYRDDEVGPAHPLLRTLDTIRDANTRVSEIVLGPLALDDVNRIVADALHCEPEHVWPLAQLVQEKTGGNPFFAIHFFTALAEEGLLAFDPVTRAWQWDIDRIRAKSYTDNVVDLMSGKLRRMSAPTQEALKQLACLGNVAEVATLALVHGETEEAMHAALWEAVRAGLIFQQDRTYKFLHDRIQQAAYSLIPDEQRADVHLRIGRVLLVSLTADQLAEHLFDVTNQLNRGAALLIDRDEKVQVARINLRAGRKAKASAAYASARAYFSVGMGLLDEKDWAGHYQLTFSLWLERAECELLSGNFEKTENLIGELLQRGASKVDQAAVYRLKVQFHVMKSENQPAVASALTCLRLFGFDLPAHPTPEQVQAEYETVWQTLNGRSIESLIDLPLMTDPDLQAAMQVLSVLTPPAYFTDFHLWCLQVCLMVKVTMQHGTSGASAHAYVYFGYALGPYFHRYIDGHRFAKLACDLVEKHSFNAYHAKILHVMGNVAFWTQPIATAIDFMRAAFRIETETGNLAYACYSAYQSVTALLLRNDPLDAVMREAQMALDFAREAKYGDAADMIGSQRRFIATMQGRTTTFSTFSDAQFDEATFEAQLTGDRMILMVCSYWILKLKARFLSGDYAEALAAADKVKPLVSAAAGQIQLLDYFYYSALTVAAYYESATADEQTKWRDLLVAHREQLREWAENYPPTFADKHALVLAEIARLEGRDADAMRLYERAIQSARENGFVQNEGLAYEVAARFYSGRDFETIAHTYLRNARNCFERWGALGKAKQLNEHYQYLHEERESTSPTATIGTSVGQLYIETVIKSSQALSSEIVLPKLIEKLMRIALEHAGAERGLLILLRGDDPQIEAQAATGHGRVEVAVRQAPVTPSDLPESVLHYVIRTREHVVLDDASLRNLYSEDEYVRQKHPRSVLCLPIVKQTKLVGALYLENNLTSRAFTSSRIAMLEMLASQAAISLENATLYSELQRENTERKRAADALRRSEAYLAEAQRLTRTGSFGWKVSSGEIFWSEENCRIFEYDNALSVTVDMVLQRVHPEDLALVQRTAGRASRDGKDFDLEHRLLMPDGSVRYVHVVGHAIGDAVDQPEFVGAVVDVTAAKRAEQALRDSEQRFRDYAETASDWFWETGPDHRFSRVEPRTAIGVYPANRIGVARWDVAADLEEEPAKWRLHIATLDGHLPFRDFGYRTTRGDGSVCYIATSGKPVFDPEGRFVGYRGVSSDVTASVRAAQAEEALREAQADLARVTRLTTMGELTASIAHEIFQPLSAVVTNGNTCLHWLEDKTIDLAKARSAAIRTVRDAKRANDIIRRIRALMIRSETQKVDVDLNGIIRDILALIHNELLKRQVSVSMALAATLPPVFGDRVQLQQLMLNLMMNGIEAMASVADRPKELTIETRVEGTDHVLVLVRDVGEGLNLEKIDRIFDPFFTTKPEGTGMGLAICRSVVEAHDGRIWASPGAPHGAVFQFTLPARAVSPRRHGQSSLAAAGIADGPETIESIREF
jgi:PAS domain S-box-containing protein